VTGWSPPTSGWPLSGVRVLDWYGHSGPRAQRAGHDLNYRPSLEDLCAYLSDRGLSKHFLPERLELVSALPMTPSGKVRKVELRARLAPRPSGAASGGR
jgi:acyl-CoA synthetase (AMP-forming)/AMP-acid ligase II